MSCDIRKKSAAVPGILEVGAPRVWMFLPTCGLFFFWCERDRLEARTCVKRQMIPHRPLRGV